MQGRQRGKQPEVGRKLRVGGVLEAKGEEHFKHGGATVKCCWSSYKMKNTNAYEVLVCQALFQLNILNHLMLETTM